eukprot:766384-Hanusia_phi.AAC.5
MSKLHCGGQFLEAFSAKDLEGGKREGVKVSGGKGHRDDQSKERSGRREKSGKGTRWEEEDGLVRGLEGAEKEVARRGIRVGRGTSILPEGGEGRVQMIFPNGVVLRWGSKGRGVGAGFVPPRGWRNLKSRAIGKQWGGSKGPHADCLYVSAPWGGEGTPCLVLIEGTES